MVSTDTTTSPNPRPDLPADRSRPTALERLARAVLRHRRLVIVGWLVILVAGMAGASAVSGRLKVDFSLPGQPGYETALKIEKTYGSGLGRAPTVIVVKAPAGRDARTDRAALAASFDRLRAQRPSLRVVDAGAAGDPAFLSRDGRTAWALAFVRPGRGFSAPPELAGIDRLVRSDLPAGYTAGTTGLTELANNGSSGGTGVFAETLFGALGALAVLAFVFASLLALVPLLVAAVAILGTLLMVLGLTVVTDVSFIVQFLVSLIGLGVAIDYSLLFVTRWREERAGGLEPAEAVVAAMRTAGRAVLLSGLTVAVGLLALVVLPVPGLRSVGFGGILIPLMSVAVTLTLLPAMLAGIGPRLEWPRRGRWADARRRHGPAASPTSTRISTRAPAPASVAGSVAGLAGGSAAPADAAPASRLWTGWARRVVRRPALAAAVATVALIVLIIPVFGLTTGQTSASALAQSGPARDSYDRLRSAGLPSGVLTPLEVLVRRDAASSTAERLRSVPGIASVAVPSAPDSNRAGTTVLVAIPEVPTLNSSSLAPVRAARSAVDDLPGVVGIAGDGAISLDYQKAVFGSFPLMFTIIALLTFVLLARAFRSLVLAAKALLLNLVSLAATFGLLVWFWQDGHGSSALFGIPATGAVTFWLPLMVFAFLFGLSMDYEVFLLARMREEYDRTGSTDAAVVTGLGRTGRLVTSAALILFLAFASLASAPNTDVKVLATGLGAGILLDATIVRALLLPALVALFGRWNWWLPAPVARLLRVPPSPVTPPAATPSYPAGAPAA